MPKINLRAIAILITLLSGLFNEQAYADYTWWPNWGTFPPKTPGPYTNAEAACRDAINSAWYDGEKKFTHHVMDANGTQALCHVELKSCHTCSWRVPNPPYVMNGFAMKASRRGTGCTGKSYNLNAGECFFDLGTSQGDAPASCSVPSDKNGNPISIINGNKFQREVFFLGADQFPIRLELVYNSLDKKWRHHYSTRLHETSTTYTVVFADGRSASFDKSTGQPVKSSELSHLTKDSAGWILRLNNGEQMSFNATGRLSRWSSPQQNAIEFTYEPSRFFRRKIDGKDFGIVAQVIKIKSKNQEILIDEYNQTLASATVLGQKFYFGYNFLTDRLNSVYVQTTPTSAFVTRNYHYESPYGPQLLTGITDERGIRYATWTYDSQARAISSEHFDGADKITVNYKSDGSSTVTNALGKQTTYRFAEFDGVKRITAIQGEPSANCPDSNSTFTYDNRGLLKTKTDNKGHITTFDYNERGLEVSRTEAYGTAEARTITTEWHPTLFLPLVVTEPNRIIRYHYDAQGRQLSRTVDAL